MSSAPSPPRVFLSHGPAGLDLARRLAADLTAKGIYVDLDDWDVRGGTSIPGFMNDALARMTHYILVATGADHDRPWVKAEWHAAFARRIQDGVRFFVVRQKLDYKEVPALLRSDFSYSLDDYDADVKALIDDIHGVSKRPPLGPAPVAVSTPRPASPTGLSAAAEVLVRLIVTRSSTGYCTGSSIDAQTIRDELGLSDEAIVDAVDELDWTYLDKKATVGCGPIGFHHLSIANRLFSEFDRFFMPWSPEDDAGTIATMLMNGAKESRGLKDLDDELQWGHRRLNPAIAWLLDRSLVDTSNEIGGHPYMKIYVARTAATRRFVRDSAS